MTVRLPSATNARVTASTSNNLITNEFPLTGAGATATKRRIDGKIGNGGPTIDISTLGRSIRRVNPIDPFRLIFRLGGALA